jgi:hypothetical protein
MDIVNTLLANGIKIIKAGRLEKLAALLDNSSPYPLSFNMPLKAWRMIIKGIMGSTMNC